MGLKAKLAFLVQSLAQRMTAAFVTWCVEAWQGDLADASRLPVGTARRPEWSAVGKKYLEDNPTCAACGARTSARTRVVPHHVEPVHVAPDKELDPGNLITLCEPIGNTWGRFCHLTVGHRGDFRSWEPDARRVAADVLARVQARPYARPPVKGAPEDGRESVPFEVD